MHTHELHSHNGTGTQTDAVDIALVSRHVQNRDAGFCQIPMWTSGLSSGKGIPKELLQLS